MASLTCFDRLLRVAVGSNSPLPAIRVRAQVRDALRQRSLSYLRKLVTDHKLELTQNETLS